MDHTYTVRFEHREHFTQVEFSKLYASDVKDAQDKAASHLSWAPEWNCISVERVG